MKSTVESTSKFQIKLEQRRQQALLAANKCMQILRHNFGATEVFLCGSLAGESPWHWHSDIDIAVRGMTQESIWNAYSALEDSVPNWLQVDLIPLEFAPTHLVDRILHKIPMSENKYLALKSHIEDELKSIKGTIQTLIDLLKQKDTIPEVALIPALASYIADFYSGCERISERVAVYLDGGLPTSKDWHQELLKQVAEPGGYERPPLWSGSLLLELDEYRKFRHLERHIYKIRLKPDRVIALAENVEKVFNKIQSTITEFYQWLEQQAEEQELN
ncbi:nucleotidyltransferase family protein [Pleurocapsa sp. PCC 7319]|uniref:nucleotidyltransferase family protein n=1 Tax=Pleurocapsa sp. PCC 7319 TaxID=118161 RepID=UPI00038155A5|nr:nucleotidyltransferase domain-containing protein [Pleurocapsa sp. PCC 7319]